MVNARKVVDDTIRSAFIPDPDLKIWEWADQYRIMPKSYPEPGPYRTSRTPYLREIMAKLSPQDPCQKIKVMKGTQLGLTEVINNWFLYCMDIRPGPLAMFLPTVDLAKRHSKKKLTPSIQTCLKLNGKVRESRTRDSGNTILMKEFPGGSLTLAGSNSNAAFRSDSIRDLALDDIDGYPPDVEGEGDPCDLAENRTDAYSNRKILMISTPTRKDLSRIEKELQDSDQRLYFVPCPLCREVQSLEWGGRDAEFGLRFVHDGPKVSDVWYECRHCHGRIDEYHKTWMMAEENGAQWIPQNPGHPDAGYKLPSFYSPLGWVSWKKIVREFLKAHKNPLRMKRWVNTRLAETYEERGSQPDWAMLRNRAEPYRILEVPHGGLLLTAGVDVHPNRLEPFIWAWGRGEECWLIYAGAIWEDPKTDYAWELLDDFLSKPIKHACGADMTITYAAIDAGDQSQLVYEQVKKRKYRWFAIKGAKSADAPILGVPSDVEIDRAGKKIKFGLKLWPVGTAKAKMTIYERLPAVPPGPRTIHFPIGLDDEFYKQLTAEKVVINYRKGFEHREWVKIYERNEALDGAVYSYCAAIRAGLLRMNWDQLEESIAPQKEKSEWEERSQTIDNAPRSTIHERLRGRVINPALR